MNQASYEVALASDISSVTLERAVDLLSCMAHPVRLAVVARLHRRGPANVSTLREELDVEQSALSHHLRHLRDARLVVGERQGKQVFYRLHDAHVGSIVEDTLQHAAELEGGD
jgi:DNA-binding transcriptional ArsR family regulator